VEVGRPPLVKTAASLFQELCYNNKDRLQASIICAGWDSKDGGSVYALPLGGAMVKQDWAIGGSGSTYVYGFVDANYKRNMNREECLEFTAKVRTRRKRIVRLPSFRVLLHVCSTLCFILCVVLSFLFPSFLVCPGYLSCHGSRWF
jgi:hypothetical protein